jgi:hypothetical protein
VSLVVSNLSRFRKKKGDCKVKKKEATGLFLLQKTRIRLGLSVFSVQSFSCRAAPVNTPLLSKTKTKN